MTNIQAGIKVTYDGNGIFEYFEQNYHGCDGWSDGQLSSQSEFIRGFLSHMILTQELSHRLTNNYHYTTRHSRHSELARLIRYLWSISTCRLVDRLDDRQALDDAVLQNHELLFLVHPLATKRYQHRRSLLSASRDIGEVGASLKKKTCCHKYQKFTHLKIILVLQNCMAS